MNSIQHLVITAAGKGTRMKLVDSGLPKEMLSLGTKPVIQYAVEEGLSAQIENIIIIINRNKEIIREYFENDNFVQNTYPKAIDSVRQLKASCNIRFIYQNRPRGEIDAIYQTKEIIGSNPFAVIYPDDIHFPPGFALRILCKKYETYNTNIVALMVVNGKNEHLLGDTGKLDVVRIAVNLYQIKRFLPKTIGKFNRRYENELRSCGLMIFSENVFRYIDEGRKDITKEEFTDIQLREIMMKTTTFIGYKMDTDFFDVGNPLGYQRCLEYINSKGDLR